VLADGEELSSPMRRLTVTVAAIDTEAPSVTFVGPGGNTRRIAVLYPEDRDSVWVLVQTGIEKGRERESGHGLVLEDETRRLRCAELKVSNVERRLSVRLPSAGTEAIHATPIANHQLSRVHRQSVQRSDCACRPSRVSPRGGFEF
jgi:hypothetical protein